MIPTEKSEPVFDLIKSMSKAEKRNFKLYATRLSGNQSSNFLALFDILDSSETYNEDKILAKCPIKKGQLPNTKAHLYKQILISLRILMVQHSLSMQVKESVEFAGILYDKGLYKQAEKNLHKLKEQSIALNMHTTTLEIISLIRRIEDSHQTKNIANNIGATDKLVNQTSTELNYISELYSSSTRLLSLHQTLGYARTEKDINLIISYFKPILDSYRDKKLSFLGNLYLYQTKVWYYYILHDFVMCYKYASRWTQLFDTDPEMKILHYDSYLRGYARLLDGLYLTKKYTVFCEYFRKLETEAQAISTLNLNANVIYSQIIYVNQLHKNFLDGDFEQAIEAVHNIDNFLLTHGKHIAIHQRMLLNYKIACLYFGDNNYTKCLEYLAKIIETKDPQIRRDLQCYSKILKLIASYEAGVDLNIDYQIRSVYSFLVKMNDLHQIQKEILKFLKNLNNIYEHELKDELKGLYERLKVYENNTVERRTFFYLDILTWLESKITGVSMSTIIKQKLKD